MSLFLMLELMLEESFIAFHSFINYLLLICYELGIVPGIDKKVRQSDKGPAFVTAQSKEEDK